MLMLRLIILVMVAFLCSTDSLFAQISFERVAVFKHPNDDGARFTGGRAVEFDRDGERLATAYYGSWIQFVDLKKNQPVHAPVRTAGDGEVGFVTDAIAYTADWESMRLWDTETGKQLGDVIPHELREDTIIQPAISVQGNRFATRASMNSMQLWDVATLERVGKPVEYGANVHSIRFDSEGKLLFVRAGQKLHVYEAETGEPVAGPFVAGWRYQYFPQAKRLVTTEQLGDGRTQIVVRSVVARDWPEVHRWNLPGKLQRLVSLDEGKVLLQASNPDYTPALFTFSLDKPTLQDPVATTADRAFDVVVSKDKKFWICNNIRDLRCQAFGESEPLWQKAIPPSGYDLDLYPFDDEHFVIIDKSERFGVCRISDGSEVWTQDSVRRFKIFGDRLAICTTRGIEVWRFSN